MPGSQDGSKESGEVNLLKRRAAVRRKTVNRSTRPNGFRLN